MNAKVRQYLKITLLPAALVLLVIGVVSAINEVSMASVTRDVTAIANIHPLTGILSTLSILLWSVAASITLFTAFILRHSGDSKIFTFLLSSSLLTAYMMFDDALLFHEALIPQYLGIDEKIVLLTLGVAVLTYLFSFKKIILETNYFVLTMAFVFLSLSVLTDGILDPWFWSLGHWEYLIEDGAKWLGIASWCSYFTHTSFHFLISAHE